MDKRIILASGSPRRKELMSYTGIPFLVHSVDVEEVSQGTPESVVRRNADLKGAAAAEDFPKDIVLSADTIVALNGRILGKPKDERDAEDMLCALENTWHTVYTAVSVRCGEQCDTRVEEAKVLFAPLTQEAIRRYIATGEPMDKAGSYALQGIGGMFVRRIEGSYSCVIGLPMATVRDMLMPYGVIY